MFGNRKIPRDREIPRNRETFGDREIPRNRELSGNRETFEDRKILRNRETFENREIPGNRELSGNREIPGNREISEDREIPGNREVSENGNIRERKERAGMEKQLREALESARASMEAGDVASVQEVWKAIRALPRTPEGLFDTSEVCGDLYEAARCVYPVYAAYETECNGKEGYPDLLRQIRKLDQVYRKGHTLENTAAYLWTLYLTVKNISPQLYEYYRELEDLFRANVREAIENDFLGGSFGPEKTGADESIRRVIAAAGRDHILLAEKYADYCGGGELHACS